jgi:hypothetical protein
MHAPCRMSALTLAPGDAGTPSPTPSRGDVHALAFDTDVRDVVPGSDHAPWAGGEDIVAEIREFVTGVREPAEPDRVLATAPQRAV